MNIKKDFKGMVFIAIALIAGILMVIISSSEREDSVSNFKYELFEEHTEQRLRTIISELKGVSGEISVMVVSNDNTPDNIIGVAIVCKSTDSAKIEIINLISSVLGLPRSKIFVGSKT